MSASPSPPLRPGDGRQLPSIPNSLPYGSGHSASRGNSLSYSNKGSNGYGPFFQEYSLLAEYNQLHQQKIPGLYVMPCAKTPLVWSGLLFIRQGLYQGGAFRFSLTIPDNYPDGDCPTFVFEYPVFHPIVNPVSGEVDIKRAFPRWRRNVNHLWQVFLYVKKIFYKMDLKSPVNQEAASLYEQDPELYKARVIESISAAKERLLQSPALDDPFALRLSPWSEAVHPDTRRQMINSSQNESQGNWKHLSDDNGSANPADLGLSWMEPNNNKIFSRDDSGSA